MGGWLLVIELCCWFDFAEDSGDVPSFWESGDKESRAYCGGVFETFGKMKFNVRLEELRDAKPFLDFERDSLYKEAFWKSVARSLRNLDFA